MLITIKYQNDNNQYKFNSFEEINNYDKVVYIYCSYNQLTSLPELPNSLKNIWCNNNKLIKNKLIKKRKYKYLIKIIYL